MRYRAPSRLAYVSLAPESEDPGELGFRVFLRALPGGPTLGLVGVGALIWSLASQEEADVVGAVAVQVGEPAEDIRADVDAYLAVLVTDGLLQVSEEV